MKKIFEIFNRIFSQYLFLIPLSLSLLFYWPYFQKIYIPDHDAMAAMQAFYTFYNNLFFHNEITQWLSYYPFGSLSSYEQLLEMTPMSYLFIFLGWLFKVQDVLLLFKVSYFFEYWLLVLGVYLLARLIFQKHSTVLLVCLMALYLREWSYQIAYDFRFFYMFPLVAYYVVLFFQKRKPLYFWLAATLFWAWVMGSGIYWVPLWIIILLMMSAVLWLYDRESISVLFKATRINILGLAWVLVIAAVFYFSLNEFVSYADFKTRSPDGHNNLGVFLTWGGIYNFGEFIRLQLLGVPTRYIGLWTLVFFLWAVLKVRTKMFFAFLIPAIFLTWLSFGGLFSVLTYYLPGMSYYRHIGLTYRFVALLMLICAGFGWEDFCKSALKSKAATLWIIAGIYIFLIDSFRFPGEWFTQTYIATISLGSILDGITFDDWRFRIMLYAGFFVLVTVGMVWKASARSQRWISGVMICIALVEMVSFHVYVYKSAKKVPAEYEQTLYTFNVSNRAFQMNRVKEPFETRQKDAWRLVNRPQSSEKYGITYEFVQFDQCLPPANFKIYLYPAGFSNFLKTRREFNNDLFQVLGCFSPKLRLVSNAVFVENVERGLSVMGLMKTLADTVVLRGADDGSKSLPAAQPLDTSSAPITVMKFTANQLLVDVNVPGDKPVWLIYVDSYHPGWHAKVNNVPVKVYEAYLAFKGVHLSPGKNTVHFYFADPRLFLCTWILIIFGLGVGIFLMVLLVRTVLWRL